ncbi:hypothetical protein U9M48_011690 [Paspalum notatum var. saurae]|uniref:Uncharacterized protein n=1 Tax=Paspalum notatum var. saurae TaxID=547442 RepID=A0AAQ3SWC4_PASNO
MSALCEMTLQEACSLMVSCTRPVTVTRYSLWLWTERHGGGFQPRRTILITAASIKSRAAYYNTHEWKLKHTTAVWDLFAGTKSFDWCFLGDKVVALHPECMSLLFFVAGETTLRAYDMNRKQVRVICNLGHGSDIL